MTRLEAAIDRLLQLALKVPGSEFAAAVDALAHAYEQDDWDADELGIDPEEEADYE